MVKEKIIIKIGASCTTRISAHPLYIVWKGMIRRCHEPTFKCYDIYGGRGISVCKLWRTDFMAFYNWAISNGWKKGNHVDRKNGNYHPKNCRIATPKQNANNKRNTKYYEINGVRRPFTEWCELNGLTSKTVAKRLKRGHNLKTALIKKLPPLTANHSKKKVELIDTFSNKKIIFDSLDTCSKYLKIDPSNTSYAVKHNGLVLRRYRIKFIGYLIPKNEKEKKRRA